MWGRSWRWWRCLGWRRRDESQDPRQWEMVMTTTVEREAKQIAGGMAPARNDSARWARVSATGGAAVWAGLAVLARVGIARFGAIELMFLFGPLVIVPLGMELGRGLGCGGRLLSVAQETQPAAAALAV